VLLPALVISSTVTAGGLGLTRRIANLPRDIAIRIVTRGLLRSTSSALAAIRRSWWTMLLPLLAASKTARRLAAVAMLCAGHPTRLTADLAHGAGTALGAIEHRSARALLPVLSAGRLAARPVDARERSTTPD
ncbi:MAG: hypothetical protein VW257_04545, partial [Quisquiliibacterium sp.]